MFKSAPSGGISNMKTVVLKFWNMMNDFAWLLKKLKLFWFSTRPSVDGQDLKKQEATDRQRQESLGV